MNDQAFTQHQRDTVSWLKQQRFENVSSRPERFEQFKAELFAKLDRLDVRVPHQSPDAVTLLYSGKLGSTQAWQIAEKIGESARGQVVTIGETELGALQNSDAFKNALKQVVGQRREDLYREIESGVWDRASRRLAREAQGDVRTLTQSAEDARVFARQELPELLNNARVSHINGVDIRHYRHIHAHTPGTQADKLSAVNRAVQHSSFGQVRDMRLDHTDRLAGDDRARHLIREVHRVDPGSLFDGTPYDRPPRIKPRDATIDFEQRPALEGVGLEDAQRIREGGQSLEAVRQAAQVRAGPRFAASVKAAGLLGTAYGAYDAKHQIEAAIDAARSRQEQWVRGGAEAANQAAKTLVTGGAAAIGALPGAAAGTLTSPATGLAGPIVGGIVTGGAAAHGADKLYEDSRPQQIVKNFGAQAAQFGYDYVSREGRLLRQVEGLKADVQKTTDPAERARLQGRLSDASAAFGQEAERNGRSFEGRAAIDRDWAQMHARFPQVDKNAVYEALDKHIAAGKRPADAARGAYSDAVLEKYPRKLAYEPLENYRAMSIPQLAEQHRQFVDKALQDRATVKALDANKDSHNNIDQGWPAALAQQRQARRVQEGLNALWRDACHVRAIRDVYQERGLQPPELPAVFREDAAQAAPPRPVSLSPEQERHWQLAHAQLGPGLRARGHDAERIERICAAAVSHVQAHAQRGQVRAFHLSKDGEQVAVLQTCAPMSEFSVREAQSTPAQQHLALAQQTAHEQAQARTRDDAAPPQAVPARAIA